MSIQSNFPNVKPSLLLDFANTKQLDNRVTFTRSTPAVYYDGKTTAMAEQNLVTYSQNLSLSPWAGGASITPNYGVAPDGTSTSNRFAGTSVSRYQLITTTIPANSIWTISAYVKASSATTINIGFNGASNGNNNVGATKNVTTSWTRIEYTLVAFSDTGFYPIFGSAFLGAGSTDLGYRDVEVWGFQIEPRSTATAYTPTTTQPITNYIPVLLSAGGNQPRFDCNPTTGESLGLLIEEQRTNLVSYSSEFSNAYWDKYNLTLNTNTIVAPDGTLTGSKLIEADTTTSHYMYPQSGTAVSAGTFTGSIYAKAGERTRLICGIWGGSDYALAQFDLANGTVLQEADAGMASITSVGNGWYRCTVKRTIGAITTYFSSGPNLNASLVSTTGAFPSYTGNGFNGIYIWGAQVEAGSFATSYIATTSASATRTADAASMTGTNFSSWFNNSEGTFYWDTQRTNTLASPEISIFNSNLGSYYGAVAFLQNQPNGNIKAYSVANSADQVNITTGTGLTGINSIKTAYAYKTNDFAGSSNGQTVATDSVGLVQNNVNILAYSQYSLNGFYYISKFVYYPLRLSNTNLVALTS